MRYIVHRYSAVTSTNDVAVRMADDGAPEGTVVVADEQTSGRGRRGRVWVSSPGTGLYLSVVLRPEVPGDSLWQLGFVASLAAKDAVKHLSGLDVRLKWPNDVLISNRKVCGILAEARLFTDVPLPVVIGIGINVNTQEFPDEIANRATSMARESGGCLFRLRDVEDALLRYLDVRYSQYAYEGFSPVIAAWRESDCVMGRSVTVNTATGTISGIAEEIGADGSLLVRQCDGSTTRITAGDVSLI